MTHVPYVVLSSKIRVYHVEVRMALGYSPLKEPSSRWKSRQAGNVKWKQRFRQHMAKFKEASRDNKSQKIYPSLSNQNQLPGVQQNR